MQIQPMAGRGGDVVRVPARAEVGQKAAWLPLDAIAEIAARSDPATLVRCAATCRDARRRIAQDPSLLARLRLRDTDRFVLPLLRGHLTEIKTYTYGKHSSDVYMVDTTAAADATRLVKTTFAGADQTQKNDIVPVDSRGGLILIRKQRQLIVCNPATRRHLVLPPEPAFPGPYWISTGVLVLLVGNRNDEGRESAAAAVGQSFQVLKVKLDLSQYRTHHGRRTHCRLLVHNFSSEHGVWSALTEIPTPDVLGSGFQLYQRPLVIGDVIHWLCKNYMLILHVGTARVNVTSLPTSFPWNTKYDQRRHYLLATASAGGNPVVLVADTDNISAWEQSKHTRIWKPRPQVVIENETMLQFKDDDLAKLRVERERGCSRKYVPELLWFGERSGAVLLRIYGSLLWLDLQSKKIVRSFSDRRISYGAKVYCPYEVDLSSWVPTFSNTVTL